MNIDMINAAAKRLHGHARRTPLLSSPFLDEIAGKRLLIKPENLQHTGSFKFRGAWSAVSAMDPETRSRGVIAYSSGNHAQGIALAAAKHGCPSVIIMPSDAPRLKIENTRALGAEVVLYDRATEDRNEIGDRLSKTRNLTLIKPFDNPHVIAGQGTTGLEIVAQCAAEGIETADILVPCGGGGLTSGIALAVENQAPKMTVHPCEPQGFDDATRSLISGKIERNPQTCGNICDAIITPQLGDLAFPIMSRLCSPGIVVTQTEVLKAMKHAFARLKIVLEPGGAVALAAALFHADQINSDAIIAVTSGGNVDAGMFASALETDL